MDRLKKMQVRAHNLTLQGKVETSKEALCTNPELNEVFRIFRLDTQRLDTIIEQFDSAKAFNEQEWLDQQASLSKLKDLGSTKELEILPLIDWKVANERLKGEPGVSYLIRTDDTAILVDVGYNRLGEDPSPLMHNMGELGITLEDFDTIVISHKHLDHVGGKRWSKMNTFSFANEQVDLSGKMVYTPVKMSYPGVTPTISKMPTKIAEGVTTIGVISTQLFFFGLAEEQALAINVDGLGVVLIVGCGHQTVDKIIQRTQKLFDVPIHAVVGGLHYPISDSRLEIDGVKIHKYAGLNRYPWQLSTIDDVQDAIGLLKGANVKTVCLSAHDSCDVALDAFRTTFRENYRDIIVGIPIVFAKQ